MLIAALTALTILGRIPALMQEGEVPGLSIVRIHQKRVVDSRAFGVANRDTAEPLTQQHVFESASLTKPVFAYAVLRLVDAGVLSLDVPLSTYLPEPVADERMKLITARMVLDHTTGLQNEVMPGETLRVHFTPGARFSYSGAGYLYLERVVEHRTGKALTTLMKELVFDPLGMTSSSYVWLPEYERLAVYGHNPANVVAPRRKPATGTIATLHTTALDYARFVIAMMNGGGLKPATLNAMLSTQSTIDESCFTCLSSSAGRTSRSLSWGLGWGLERTARGARFFHWGENNAEFQNFVMADRNGDAVIVFTNSGNGFSIMPEVVAGVFPGEHPAFAWMGYESYRSPGKRLLREILARGAAAALQSPAAASLSERDLNRLGYNLLQRKRTADAIAVFTRNVEKFPASFNVYDSLGEAYMAAGDNDRAIANYQRSLELNRENRNAAEMLETLRSSRAPRPETSSPPPPPASARRERS